MYLNMWYSIENDAQQEQSPYPRDLPPVIQQILAMPGPGDRGEAQGADFANMDVGFGGIMVPEPARDGDREVEMDPDGMMVDDLQGAAGARLGTLRLSPRSSRILSSRTRVRETRSGHPTTGEWRSS